MALITSETAFSGPTERHISESEVLRTVNKDVKAELQAPGVFPDSLVVQPLLEHKQTFIILHGRGSFAARFGPPLLDMVSANNKTLQTQFPHAKIIFVTASRNKATIYKKSLTHQWFDNWHLEDYTKRQDLMSDGLKKSCDYIHGVLKEEINFIGAENVVLWGMSQGCATSLSALLSWDGEPFGAMVGMCGWLPYSNVIKEMVCGSCTSTSNDNMFGEDDNPFGNNNTFQEDDDPFAHSDDEKDDKDGKSSLPKAKKDKATEAVENLREEIQMEDKTGSAFKDVPIFLGHGV